MIDRPDAAPDGGEEGEDGEAAAGAKKEKPEPSYATISTEELCVRVNSLVHCINNIKQLASRIAYELGDAEVSIGELQAELTGAWEEAMLNVTRARQEVREELQTSVDHVQKALGQASTDQNGAHSGRKKTRARCVRCCLR